MLRLVLQLNILARAWRGEAVLYYLLVLAPAVQSACLLRLLRIAMSFIAIRASVRLIVLREVLNRAVVLEIHVIIL